MTRSKVGFAEVKESVVKEFEKSKKMAEREAMKMKKGVEASLKKIDEYMKKNPEKAAAISAGIGAALGAAVALLMTKKKKK
ncbi:MAG: hypothetical protein HYV45_00375 [Candidatus Moranbacteria bacterium]|nr:hypothetical protein [Candidatus Moranbacteria bacterium]